MRQISFAVGRFSWAVALAGPLKAKECQVNVYVDIARLANDESEKTGEQADREMTNIAEMQESHDRDGTYYAIVRSLADLGDKACALN